jgi:CheY-like chemotaxis protein
MAAWAAEVTRLERHLVVVLPADGAGVERPGGCDARRWPLGRMTPPREIEILLVEDDSSDAELTLRALKARHLANQVFVARDGAEALDFFFGDDAHGPGDVSVTPKIILLDLNLPKVDGLEVLRRLKADARTRSVPVVVLTSSREEPDVAAAYRLGANSYIVKPVDFEAFARAVSDVGMYWLLVNEPPG